MALLVWDGFDQYSAVADMTMDGWSIGNTGASLYPGAFGPPGKCVVGNLTKSLPANLATLIIGVRAQNGFNIIFNDVGTNQCGVNSSSAGVVQIYNTRFQWGPLQAQSLPGVVPQSGWFFLEISATINGSAGAVTVKINGNTVLMSSGINTQTSGNAYANNIWFNGSYDDLYVCDTTTGSGTYPCNTFIGDKRVITAFPTGNVTTNFTPASPVTLGQPVAGGGGNWQAVSVNTLILTAPRNAITNLPGTGTGAMDDPVNGPAPRMGRDGVITAMSLYTQTNYPAMKIRPVIASINAISGLPVTILYVGDEKIGLSAGANTLTFGGVTATVTKDTNYALGFITDTAFALDAYSTGSSAGDDGYKYGVTYVSPPGIPPSTLPNPASGIGNDKLDISYSMTYTNYGAVSEDSFDGDVAYNVSSSVGAIDLYTIAPGLPAGAKVYGVRLIGAYRKDDAGSRSIANLVKNGATQSVRSTQNLGTSYQYLSDVMAVDPTTGISWVTADVNALKIGSEVIS